MSGRNRRKDESGQYSQRKKGRAETEAKKRTNLLLLLVNVSDLEPDIDLGERTRRVLEDEFEALNGHVRNKIRDQRVTIRGTRLEREKREERLTSSEFEYLCCCL